MYNQLLIDGDQIAHIVAYREPTSHKHIEAEVRNYIYRLKSLAHCSFYKLYVQGKGNFRHDIATLMPYKGNRKKNNGELVNEIREIMRSSFGAISKDNIETDDAIGLSQTSTTCICSSDKDLNMIPGWHFNITNHNTFFVEKEEAIKNFYIQLITGDKVDNIPGLSERAPLRGIGKKTAEKHLQGITTEVDMFQIVKNLYENKYGQQYKYNHWNSKESISCSYIDILNENAQLLWIQQLYKEKWTQPI